MRRSHSRFCHILLGIFKKKKGNKSFSFIEKWGTLNMINFFVSERFLPWFNFKCPCFLWKNKFYDLPSSENINKGKQTIDKGQYGH